jgi:hypothetical protein
LWSYRSHISGQADNELPAKLGTGRLISSCRWDVCCIECLPPGMVCSQQFQEAQLAKLDSTDYCLLMSLSRLSLLFQVHMIYGMESMDQQPKDGVKKHSVSRRYRPSSPSDIQVPASLRQRKFLHFDIEKPSEPYHVPGTWPPPRLQPLREMSKDPSPGLITMHLLATSMHAACSGRLWCYF